MGQKPSKTSKPKSFLPTDLTCDRQYYENLINTKRIAPYEEGEEEEEEKEQEECFICYGMFEKGLNRCRQCKHGVCTYCYIRMKPLNEENVPCPYCKDQPWMISYYGIRPKTPDEEEEEDQNKQAPKPKLNYKDKLLGEGIDERTISMMEHHMPMDMRTNIGNIQRLEELLIQRGLNQSLVQQPTIPPTNVENQQSDTHNNKLNPNHPEYDEEYATNYLMEMTQFEQEVQNIEVVQCIDTTEETEVDDHNLHDLMEIMDRECQEEEEEEEEEDNWSYDTPPIADEFIPETMNQHVQMIHETLDKLIINLQKQDSVEAFINILNDDGLLAGVPFSKLIEQVEDDDDDEDYNY